jgi:hypothetical protein
MKTRLKILTIFPILALTAVSVIFLTNFTQAHAASSFRFVAWADTKTNTEDLSRLSDQVTSLGPAFTIFPGDLEDDGFTASGMANWKKAINGQLTGESASNGMFDITLAVRGNHDDRNTSDWQAYFNFGQTVTQIGGSNHSFMPGQEDLTYSFDYQNAHFIAVDVPGSMSQINTAQIEWINNDLSAAAGRGLTHAFIYFHGPIYCSGGHCSCSERVCSLDSDAEALITVLNKHPIVSATFHGHEHTYAHTYLDTSRIPADGSFEGVTHPFHQFITGAAGAGPYDCDPNRCDFNMAELGFTTVDVSGNNVTVSFYQDEKTVPVHIVSFTKDGVPPQVFEDVPPTHPYFTEIEALYNAGFTAGCQESPRLYCPDRTMDRAESAVFIERGIHGVDIVVEEPGSQSFADLELSSWAAKWAQALYNDGFTAGCGVDPLVYCPWQDHTRAEGSVFYLRMLNGYDFTPPEASGVFTDVPVNEWYAKWVEAAYGADLIPACSDSPLEFCPDGPLDRGLAAFMMVQAKSLIAP